MLCEMQSFIHVHTCRNAFWSFYYDTVKIQISAQGADLVFWTWGRSAYWRRGSAYCIVMWTFRKNINNCIFTAGPKTTVTIKYWELLSTSVSVKEASCGRRCETRDAYWNTTGEGDANWRRGIYWKKACYPGRLWDTGANSNFNSSPIHCILYVLCFNSFSTIILFSLILK